MPDINDILSALPQGSTQQAPGAPDQSVNPLVMQALQSSQAGGLPPTIPGGTGGAAGGLTGNQSFLDTYTNMFQNLSKQLQEINKPSAAELEFQKRSQYTVEQRAHDIYNSMMGIKKVPVVPVGPMPEGQEPQYKDKIDWKKYPLAVLSEMGRAMAQKENYVPARDRAQHQALQEYQSEINPIAKEVQYNNQMRTWALRDMTSLTNNATSNLTRQAATDVRSKLYEQQGNLDNAKKMVYIARYEDAERKLAAGQPEAQVEMLKIHHDLLADEDEYTKARTVGQVQSNEGLSTTKGDRDLQDINAINRAVAKGDFDTAKQIKQQMDIRNQALGAKNITVVQTDRGPMAADKRTLPNYMTGGQGAAQSQGPGVNATQGGGEQAPKTPAIDPVTGKPDKYRDDIQKYYTDISSAYQGKPVAPVGLTFKDDLPPGTDPRLAAYIHSAPIGAKVQAGVQTKNDAALKGAAKAQEMYGLLKDFSPSDLGNLKGMWTKLTTKYADPTSWSNVPADKFERFAQAAQILGAHHAAVQGFRSTQFVEDIGKALDNLAQGKKTLAGKIYEYEDTFNQQLQHNQELKATGPVRNWTTENVVRAFHPDAYKSIYGKEVGPPDVGGTGAKGASKNYVKAEDLLKARNIK